MTVSWAFVAISEQRFMGMSRRFTGREVLEWLTAIG